MAALHSALPFLLTTLLYPLLFISRLPSHPTPATIAKVRESLSAFHCTLTTILCSYCLYHHDTLRLLSSASLPPITRYSTPNACLPIITVKSSIANTITAYETGYLLGDTLIVLYARHIHVIARLSRNIPSHKKRGLNIRHLLTHHIPLLVAFMLLQFYVMMGWERGVLIVILLMLQNFSSPFGTLRWYLSVTVPEQRRLILLADIAYITAYAACRVWLLYWVVARFASIQGMGVLGGVWQLKWPCQLGMAGMAYINVGWLTKILRRAWVGYMARSRVGGMNKAKVTGAKRE